MKKQFLAVLVVFASIFTLPTFAQKAPAAKPTVAKAGPVAVPSDAGHVAKPAPTAPEKTVSVSPVVTQEEARRLWSDYQTIILNQKDIDLAKSQIEAAQAKLELAQMKDDRLQAAFEHVTDEIKQTHKWGPDVSFDAQEYPNKIFVFTKDLPRPQQQGPAGK